jgi:hypothetical protein
MSDDKHWYVADEKPPSLYMWIFTQMTMGAAYAALVCMVILFFVLFWRALSALLPEDPFALLETGSRIVQAIA